MTTSLFIIRPAELHDIPGIMNVLYQNLLDDKIKSENPSELETIQRQGFLIQSFSTEDLEAYLSDKENYTVLVSCERNTIVGYIISHHIQKLSDDFSSYFKKALSEQWETHKILYLKQIAKLPGLKKVGPDLLENLLEKAVQQDYQFVACAIAEVPIKNIPSIHFHSKFGFERIGNAYFKHFTYGIYLRKLHQC